MILITIIGISRINLLNDTNKKLMLRVYFRNTNLVFLFPGDLFLIPVVLN